MWPSRGLSLSHVQEFRRNGFTVPCANGPKADSPAQIKGFRCFFLFYSDTISHNARIELIHRIESRLFCREVPSMIF